MAVYPTGYSNQPIDFSGATNALMKSAMQSKIQEIKRKSEELSDNEKFILKAMDVTTIPEISGKLRDKFDTEISDLRNKTTQIFRQRDGSLTSSDKAQIEKMNIELQNRMNLAKNNLGKIAELNKIVTNPASRTAFKLEPFSLELGQLIDKFDKGEDVGTELTALPMKHAIIPSEEELVAQSVKRNGIKFDDIKTLEKGNGKYIYTTTVEENSIKDKIKNAIKLDSAVNWKYQKEMPDGTLVWDEDKIAQTATNMIPMYAVKKVEERPISSRGSGGGSAGAGNKLTLSVEEATTPSHAKGNAVKLSGTAVERDFGTVLDESGKEISLGMTKGSPQEFIAGEDGKLWVKILAKGGYMKDSGGEMLYNTKGVYEKDRPNESIPESKLQDKANVIFENRIKAKGGYVQAKELEEDKPAVRKEKDGSISFVYKVRKKAYTDEGRKTNPREEVVVSYKPAKSDEALSSYYKEINPTDAQVWISDVDLRKPIQGTNRNLNNFIQSVGEGDISIAKVKGVQPSTPSPAPTNEVKRKTADGRIAIFDATTKQFLRYE